MAQSISWDRVTPSDVERALREYDKLGPEQFFATHGFARTTTYELVWNDRTYPPKAILGTAYEFATGGRLASSDFEGGKSGAVKVLGRLGFAVRPITQPEVTWAVTGESPDNPAHRGFAACSPTQHNPFVAPQQPPAKTSYSTRAAAPKRRAAYQTHRTERTICGDLTAISQLPQRAAAISTTTQRRCCPVLNRSCGACDVRTPR